MPSPGAIRAGRAFVEIFADTSALMTGLHKAEVGLNQFGREIRRAGMEMMAAGAALTTPLTVAFRDYAGFQEQLARVSTMLDNPPQWMPKYAKAISAMSVEFGRSTEDLNAALYQILSAQVPPSMALDVLREGAKGAIGGLSSVNDSVYNLITLLQNYGGQLKDAADAEDWMFAVLRRGRFEGGYTDLVTNLGKVVPIAAAAHVNINDLGAALALTTRAGLDAEQATTGIAYSILEFLRKTPQAAAAAKRLGVDLSASGLQGHGLYTVMQRLGHLGPEAIAQIFPRQRGLRALAAAALHAKELGMDMERVTNRAGEAQNAFQKMAATPEFSLNRLWQAIRYGARALGDGIAFIQKYVDELRGMIVGAADWVRSHAKLVVTIGKIAAAATILGAVLVTTGMGLIFVGQALSALDHLIRYARIAALGLHGAFSGILGLFRLLPGALMAIATPEAIVIAALAAFFTLALWGTGVTGKAIDWLRGVFTTLKEDAVRAFGAIKDALVAGDLGLAARIFWLTLKLEWERGTLPLRKAWQDAIDGMRAAWEIATNAIANAFLWLTNKLETLWAAFEGRYKRATIRLGDWLAKQWVDISGNWSGESPEDIQFQKDAVDQMTQHDLGAVDTEQKKRTDALEAEHKAAQALLKAQHDQAMAQIGKENEAKIKAAEDEVAKARTAWQEALMKARHEREWAEGGSGAAGAPGNWGMPQVPQIPDAADIVGSAAVAGTFSGVDLWGLAMGGGSAMDRTASATEQTAKNTEQMMNQMQNAGIPVTT